MRNANYRLTLTDMIMSLLAKQHSISFFSEKWLSRHIENKIDPYFIKSEYTDNSEKENETVSGSGKDRGNAGFKKPEKIKEPRQLSSEMPDQFSLSQNFPNPFSAKTNINYQCPMMCFISLKVYDLHWNEVSTIVYQKQVPGTYQAEFDGSNFPPGIYFYRMDTENFSDTKKMFIER